MKKNDLVLKSKMNLQLLRSLGTFMVLALLAGGGTARATNHDVHINEIMAGLNGDSSIQFVEMVIKDASQQLWGPPPGQATGHAMLGFFDAAGRQTGRFVFPSNVPPGQLTVLIATREFATLTGITPDFIMPKSIIPVAGKVCFMHNPDASAGAFPVQLCLSYGGTNYTGSTDGAGVANTNLLTILGAQSLRRFQNFAVFGPFTQLNSHFQSGTPTPSSTRNTASMTNAEQNVAGDAVLPGATNLVRQGETLFLKETFLGNGRTCASCHVPGDDFGLTAAKIAALSASDPLFVHELNVNRIAVSAAGSALPGSVNGTQPSDFFLGGSITGSLSGASSAVLLAGSGTNY